MFYLYILQSLDKKHFYIGATASLKERLSKHNKGYTKSTKPFLPWQIIYSECYTSKELAMKREYFLKSPKGYLEKRNLIDMFSN